MEKKDDYNQLYFDLVESCVSLPQSPIKCNPKPGGNYLLSWSRGKVIEARRFL